MESRVPTDTPASRAPRWPLIVVVALAWAAHRGNLSYGILGLDSYMQIIAARIETWGDFWGTFSERLTDGRIGPAFYRPWQNLSIALDHAFSGLDPRGYQLQTFVLFGATAGLLFAAARRLLGASFGAGVGAAVFALHPNLLNVLPAPCRRSELWVVFFLLAALWVLPLGRDGARRARCWLAAVFVVLAAASKETGAMGAGLVLLHQFFFAAGSEQDGALVPRARRATVAALPAFLGTALYLALRTQVLGGLGGYPPTKDDAGFVANLTSNLRALSVDLFLPSGAVEAPAAQAVGLAAAGLFTMLVVLALLRGSREVRAAVWLGLGWAVPPLVLLGTRSWYGPWYATIPLAGGCLALAAIAQQLADRRALVPALGAGALVAAALAASPLWLDYPHWREATAGLERALGQLDESMPSAELGEVVRVESPPYYHPDEPGFASLRWVALISDRGLQAYAEMKWPDKNPKARFVHGPAGLKKSRPGSVTIAVPFVSFEP